MMQIRTTEEFYKWFSKLRDLKAKAIIAVRINRIKTTGNLGDYKILADEISELRISYGPGYRIYFVRRGDKITLLLNAGDKSSQQRDIDKAKKLDKEYYEGDFDEKID